MTENAHSARISDTPTLPGDGHRLARWLFLRGLGVVYLAAFVSFWWQLSGLIGADGIAPADLYVERMENIVSEREHLSAWTFPSLTWFVGAHETTLHILAAAGSMLSVALIIGVLPRAVIAGLWVIYLSFFTVSSPFLNYQWDILLLEVSVLAFFYAPGGIWPKLRDEKEPSTLAVWMLKLLLFKLIWSSGMVKMNSNDPSWQDLSAMDYHYWTQPIPHQLAWYAHNAGDWFRQAGVIGNHVVELAIPWLILFTPRGWLLLLWAVIAGLTLFLGLGDLSLLHTGVIGVAAFLLAQFKNTHGRPHIEAAIPGVLIMGLMLSVGATGNYGFFNLLTAVMAFICFSDRVLYRLTPSALLPRLPDMKTPSRREFAPWRLVVVCAAVILIPLNAFRLADVSAGPVFQKAEAARKQGSDSTSDAVLATLGSARTSAREWVRGFALVNGYGLFARMTKKRHELIVEGSHDRREWKAYRFEYKPDTAEDLHFAGLHMPRLDWQMWFAALYPRCSRPWFFKFLHSLMEGSPSVLGLMEENPFPDTPPKYLRVRRVKATFTSKAEGETEPGVWVFRKASDYCPTVTKADLEKSASGRKRL